MREHIVSQTVNDSGGFVPADSSVDLLVHVFAELGSPPPRVPVLVDETKFRALRNRINAHGNRSQLDAIPALLEVLENWAVLRRGDCRLLTMTHSSPGFHGYALVRWQRGGRTFEVQFVRSALRLPPRAVLWLGRRLGWYPNPAAAAMRWRLRRLQWAGWRRPPAASDGV